MTNKQHFHKHVFSPMLRRLHFIVHSEYYGVSVWIRLKEEKVRKFLIPYRRCKLFSNARSYWCRKDNVRLFTHWKRLDSAMVSKPHNFQQCWSPAEKKSIYTQKSMLHHTLDNRFYMRLLRPLPMPSQYANKQCSTKVAQTAACRRSIFVATYIAVHTHGIHTPGSAAFQRDVLEYWREPVLVRLFSQTRHFSECHFF